MATFTTLQCAVIIAIPTIIVIVLVILSNKTFKKEGVNRKDSNININKVNNIKQLKKWQKSNQ